MSPGHLYALNPTGPTASFSSRRGVRRGLEHRGADPSKLLERKRRLPGGRLPPVAHFRLRPARPCSLISQVRASGSAGSLCAHALGSWVSRGGDPRGRAWSPGRCLLRGPTCRGFGGRGGRGHGEATLKPWCPGVGPSNTQSRGLVSFL